MKKILVLISEQPYPPFGGSKARNLELWPELAKLADLKVLGTSSNPQRFSFSFPTTFYPYERSPLFIRVKNAFQLSYHQWPISKQLEMAIEREIHEWKPDVVHAEELRMWRYIPQNYRGKTSCTFHNVETDLLKKTQSSVVPFLRPFSQSLHQKNLEIFETDCVNSVKHIFAYSEVDRQILQKKYGKNFGITSGGVKLVPYSWNSQAQTRTILFTGSLSYWPNVEAIEWYLREIHPKIRNEVNLRIAGSNASINLKTLLQKENIQFIDSPPTLEPHYKEAAISIVPLLNGSGTRGKILESLGNGRMVVSTKKGAEGLSFTSGEGISFADDSEDFAKQILHFLNHPEERKSVAEKGFKKVEAYSWEKVAMGLMEQWKQ